MLSFYCNPDSAPLRNQNEILKRGITWTEQKPKGTTFKVQSIATENPLYIDTPGKDICCQIFFSLIEQIIKIFLKRLGLQKSPRKVDI